jgi:AcrR family transcriptional regulator
MDQDGIGRRSRRDEHTEGTRQALLSAGREIFAREGYQAASMEAISRAARVTRGAFYHHFEDKTALFDAVVVAMQVEAAERIQARAKAQRNIWERLTTGIDAYLDVCLEPAYARIVIQEAAAILGNQRYREIEEAHPMALLRATLNALKREGEIVFDDIDLLCRLLDAMICKVAVMLPEAENTKTLRKSAHQLFESLLAGVRPARPTQRS